MYKYSSSKDLHFLLMLQQEATSHFTQKYIAQCSKKGAKTDGSKVIISWVTSLTQQLIVYFQRPELPD